eukprot:3503642-Rhodomonas_salina.1
MSTRTEKGNWLLTAVRKGASIGPAVSKRSSAKRDWICCRIRRELAGVAGQRRARSTTTRASR